MSYNQNFYNNQNFTFQNYGPRNFVPPPPPMLRHGPRPQITSHKISDQDFIKQFEQKLPKDTPVMAPKSITISEIHAKLKELVTNLENLKSKEKELSEKLTSYTDDEWQTNFKAINHEKEALTKGLANFSNTHLVDLKKLLAKRAAKRLRLKRLRIERKKEKEDRIKKSEENSRKINENLQKIKDEIDKAQQKEQTKIQADIVLKEVIRKKQDAKKCVVKLDALKRLRRARLNTAKGRGEQPSENDTEEFENRIDKLKSVWAQKLINYEKEEEDLRQTLEEAHEPPSNGREAEVCANLGRWREALFGDAAALPQADFQGDVNRFIATRYQWDQFVHSEGTPLPVGWITPSPAKTL